MELLAIILQNYYEASLTCDNNFIIFPNRKQGPFKDMNRLVIESRVSVIAALVEGTSINATCRMTGVAKHTVLKLLKDIGCACAAYHNANVRNLRVRRIQADEIWAFVHGKDKNLTLEQVQAGMGSVWTWTALDADTKLIVSYMLGDRGAATALSFMRDVAGRLAHR